MSDLTGEHARFDFAGGRWETTRREVSGVLTEVDESDGKYVLKHTTPDGEVEHYKAEPPTDADDDHCSHIFFKKSDGEWVRIGHADEVHHNGVILPN